MLTTAPSPSLGCHSSGHCQCQQQKATEVDWRAYCSQSRLHREPFRAWQSYWRNAVHPGRSATAALSIKHTWLLIIMALAPSGQKSAHLCRSYSHRSRQNRSSTISYLHCHLCKRTQHHPKFINHFIKDSAKYRVSPTLRIKSKLTHLLICSRNSKFPILKGVNLNNDEPCPFLPLRVLTRCIVWHWQDALAPSSRTQSWESEFPIEWCRGGKNSCNICVWYQEGESYLLGSMQDTRSCSQQRWDSRKNGVAYFLSRHLITNSIPHVLCNQSMPYRMPCSSLWFSAAAS